MAQHVADEFGVEQEEDVWRLTPEDLVAVEEALKLKRVFADKLKEAVQAAQVFILCLHVDCPMKFCVVFSSLRTGERRHRHPTANMYPAILFAFNQFQ